jgi:hypothetical protein
MLHIYFGQRESLHTISDHFDMVFTSEWIDNTLSREMILGVDNSEVIKGNVIESPVFGTMPPQWLSGGVKGLILMAFDDSMNGDYFYGEQFGDNTLPYMLKIARNKDIYVALDHYFKFPKDMTDEIYIDNTNEIVKGYDGFYDAYVRLG